MKKYKKVIFIIIFLIGISLLLYPKIGSVINIYKQKKVLEKYEETINLIDDNLNKKLYEEAVLYNEKVYSIQRENRKYNLEEEYKKILKIDNNMIMGYIDIPVVNIKLPIYHGVSDSILQNGVGHVKETSLPIGTNNQNSMLMGHSGLPTSKIFTNLEKLKIGDYFKIKILNNEIYYKVIEIEVIEPKELINKIRIEKHRDLVTLVTCTPYGVNSHRLVIIGEYMEYIEKIDNNNKYKSRNNDTFIITLSTITLAICLLLKVKK